MGRGADAGRGVTTSARLRAGAAIQRMDIDERDLSAYQFIELVTREHMAPETPEDFLRMGSDFAARQSEMWHRCTFPLRAVLSSTGMSEQTLRNWLTRGRLDLDADKARKEGGNREFSQRDICLIAVANGLANVGIPISEALPLAEKVMPMLDGQVLNITGQAGDPILIAWQHSGSWQFSIAYDTQAGLLSQERIPPVTLNIRPMAILKQTISRLEAHN